jgi:hypothetical protein
MIYNKKLEPHKKEEGTKSVGQVSLYNKFLIPKETLLVKRILLYVIKNVEQGRPIIEIYN